MNSNILLWMIQLVLAAVFLTAGGMKVFLPADAFDMPIVLPRPVFLALGVAELLGAVGLPLPSRSSADGCPSLFEPFVGDYAAVRLPTAVRAGRRAHALLPPARRRHGRRWGLPVLARGVSRHAWGLGLRRVRPRLALAVESPDVVEIQ